MDDRSVKRMPADASPDVMRKSPIARHRVPQDPTPSPLLFVVLWTVMPADISFVWRALIMSEHET